MLIARHASEGGGTQGMDPRQPGTDSSHRNASPGGASPPEWPINPRTGQPVPRPLAPSGYNPRANGTGEPPEDGPTASYALGPAGGTTANEERPPWEEDEPGYGSWEWEATVNRSLPSGALTDVTASGKFTVVPLTPGMSVWGRGISAP